MSQYKGADWIKDSLKKECSPLGENVADLLGDVFRGIYHLRTSALNRVEWDNKDFIRFILSWKSLATFDGDELTRLVVLSHDRMIRVDLDAVSPHNLEILFHQRRSRDGDISDRMPTMENHIALIRVSV